MNRRRFVLKPSPAIIDFIKAWEGLRLIAYPDAGGMSVGYGHHLIDGEPQTIDMSQAIVWLESDAGRVAESLDRAVSGVEQNQFDAMVSLAYNCGSSAIANSHLVYLVNQGQYRSAAYEFRRWDHEGMKEIPVLKRRREAERNIFINADYSGRP